MVLYDEKGLRLYDAITEDAPEYYLFGAELGLFKEHGAEIARAMGFPQPLGSHHGNGQQGSEDQEMPAHEQSRGEKVDEKWGDVTVGKWNNGVNGEHNESPRSAQNGHGHSAQPGQHDLSEEDKQRVGRGWDIVELGAGLVAHLLSCSPTLAYVSNLDHFIRVMLLSLHSSIPLSLVPCARHRSSSTPSLRHCLPHPRTLLRPSPTTHSISPSPSWNARSSNYKKPTGAHSRTRLKSEDCGVITIEE